MDIGSVCLSFYYFRSHYVDGQICIINNNVCRVLQNEDCGKMNELKDLWIYFVDPISIINLDPYTG